MREFWFWLCWRIGYYYHEYGPRYCLRGRHWVPEGQGIYRGECYACSSAREERDNEE